MIRFLSRALALVLTWVVAGWIGWALRDRLWVYQYSQVVVDYEKSLRRLEKICVGKNEPF